MAHGSARGDKRIRPSSRVEPPVASATCYLLRADCSMRFVFDNQLTGGSGRGGARPGNGMLRPKGEGRRPEVL